MAVPNGIVFYGYSSSPYAQKVKAYLALRNIAYAECRQHYMLPRPDLAALGVHYRRIPVMAIGRDVYVDTRAMIRRLEQLFPPSAEHPGLSSTSATPLGHLLNYMIGSPGGIFSRATSMFSPESGPMKDPAFQKDRAEFFGPNYVKGGWVEAQKEGLTHMRLAFDLLEGMLQDGNEWLASTPQLSIADWEAHWVFKWYLTALKAPKVYFNEQAYPKTFAWLARYDEALKAAVQRSGKPSPIKGDAALEAITSAEYTDNDLVVDAEDPVKLQRDAEVQVYPTDGGGKGHEDRGHLIKLTKDEVAIRVLASNGKDIHLHAPRWFFRIRPVAGDKAKL